VFRILKISNCVRYSGWRIILGNFFFDKKNLILTLVEVRLG